MVKKKFLRCPADVTIEIQPLCTQNVSLRTNNRYFGVLAIFWFPIFFYNFFFFLWTEIL